MSDDHPDGHPDDTRPPPSREAGEGSSSGKGDDRDASFVQRLERHFGKDVDPEISLQRDEDASPQPTAGGEPPQPGPDVDPTDESATSRGLIKRLSTQITAGPRYRARQELARGGMGTILRVWDGDLRRNLAMKVMHGRQRFGGDSTDAFDVDEEKLGRFLEEAQITGQLDHPGIVPVHDLGIDDSGRLYFTMRLVRGRELKDAIDQARAGEGTFSKARILGMILRVCESMAFAHSKGVVHRDLKPSNIMVGRFGEVYVMDWGLARVLGRDESAEARLKRMEESALSLVRTVRKDESEMNPDSPLVTMDGDVVGTPSYMALEQAKGKLDQVGPRSDVYSLGAILYYLLTGKAPYVEPGERVSPHTVLNRVLQGPPEPVRELAKDEPAELIAICEKAMQRDAADRYASMLEVAEDIQAFLEDRVVSAYEGGALAEFRKWVVRNKGMAAGVAGMVTLSIVSALGFAWQKQNQVDELARQQEETRRAKEAAEASEAEAMSNLVLAQDREEEARSNARRASENAAEARRSGYRGNILAADFSLKLDDVVEARAALQGCEAGLRGWEWEHLRLKASAQVGSLGRIFNGGVDEVTVTPDGETILTLARNGRLRFYDRETRNPVDPGVIALTVGAAGALTPLDMDLAADGSRVAVVGNDARIRIYDTRLGGAPLELPKEGTLGHDARVSAVAFSRNGRFLATGADNGTVIVWDKLGDLVERAPAHTKAVSDIAWSPDSRMFATASTDGTIKLWDASFMRASSTLKGHQGPVWGVAWGEALGDGNAVYSAGEDGILNKWNDQGRLLAAWPGHGGAIRSIVFHPRLEVLATGSRDRTVRVWNARTGDFTVLRGHEAPVNHATFVPDGRTLLSCAEDGAVELWDPRGDLTQTPLEFGGAPVHEGAIGSIEFSPDGDRLLTAGEDGDVILWDSLAGQPLRRLVGHESVVFQAVFDPTGQRAYSASNDETVLQWDLETVSGPGKIPHERRVTSVAITPDGSRLVTGCADKVVRIYDARTLTLISSLEGGAGMSVLDIAICKDGRRFATCSNDLRLWTLGRDEPDLIVREILQSIDFSPDGTRLIGSSARRDRYLLMLDAATGETIHQLRERSGRVRAVAFAPDGARFASGSSEGKVSIRDTESGEVLLALEWPGQEITALNFSPDGTRLAAGTRKGLGRIWETGLVPERRARWNELQDLDEATRPLVEELFDELFYEEEVRKRILGDGTMEAALRENAIRLTYLHGDDPEALLNSCLEEALPAGRDETVYRQALDRARAAQGMIVGRDDPHVLVALGVAQARNRLYRDGTRTLEEAGDVDEDRPSLSPRERAIRLLFLALTRQHEGASQRAQDAFDLAHREFQVTPVLQTDPDLARLAGEVEELFLSE